MSDATSPSAAPPMDRRIERKPWRKWAPWGAGAGGLALAAALYVALSPGAGAKAVDRSTLQISEVRRAAFQDFVPARGEVQPLQTVYVDAVEGGRVERLTAADGALVRPGELLAVLSNPQLTREVGAEEADISGRTGDTRGQLLQLQRSRGDREREAEEARFELLRAEQNLRLRGRLHEKGFISDTELATLKDEADYRRQRLAALQASLRRENATVARQSAEIERTIGQLQGNLADVRRSLDALNIRAPVGGRLTAFELQPGQTVTAGQRVGQVDTEGAYKLVAQVDEFYLGRVSPGQSAVARHDGREYPLEVSRLLPQVRDGRFQTEFTFTGAAPAGVRRGQTLDVELTLGDTRPALVLPNSPFVESTGGAWAFVVDRDGRRAERRAIRTGRRNPQFVEVLEGLRPGERVVTSDYDRFTQQSRLALR